MADTQNITENLLEMYGRDDWIMRFNFRMFMKLSGLAALPLDSKILDCGCGMGHLILMMNAAGFGNVAGLDAAPEMVESAKKLTHADIILCDVLEIEKHFAPESLDAVIISDIIHHIPSSADWQKMLAGCSAALRPGGSLIIREPFPNLAIRALIAMSRMKFLHVGFLKSRLQSFIEEDALVRYFFENWVPNYKPILLGHGFVIERDLNWLVHRITTAKKAGGSS